ncbi:hypothetical protein [Streptomyces tendae]|uniref:hypothetical protein n=1 Tax=Streptomyces tendae TaxID=1932 RepID=UPI0037182E57
MLTVPPPRSRSSQCSPRSSPWRRPVHHRQLHRAERPSPPQSEGLIYAVKGCGVFFRTAPTPGKNYSSKVVQHLQPEELERQAHRAVGEFAHLADAELKALADQIHDELNQTRTAYQAAVEKGRKITRELARRGQLAPPLHDDPAAARKELEERLADAKKRRQHSP